MTLYVVILYTVLIFIRTYYMNTINQTESGCFLLDITAFRIQNKKSFNEKVLQSKAIKVEGIYTYPDTSYTVNYKNEKIYDARRGGLDFYDYRNVSILVDGTILKGHFNDMYNNRIRYYLNTKGHQTVLVASMVTLEYDDIFSGICKKSKSPWFTLIVNIPLSYMDTMATKLVSY